MSNAIKRLRIFAGPNGSGKSTLYNYLVRTNYFTPYYHINPDYIFQELDVVLNLSAWPISFDEEELFNFFEKSSIQQHSEIHFSSMVELKEKKIYIKDNFKNNRTYLSAAIADFIRHKMLLSGSSFSFETVFSHSSKVSFIQSANDAGYKTYLYFIATTDPVVNLERVKNRVQKGGHSVPENKIFERYYRTLSYLHDGFSLADRDYIFDNSENQALGTYDFFAEKKQNKLYISSSGIPKWFNDHLLDKL
jgi:predicted ABC-type ATPase